MADSFFSQFSLRFSENRNKKGGMDNPKFQSKQRLMKQASEAYSFAKQCEKNLKQTEQQYAAKNKSLRQQINHLKSKNKELSTQIKVKDQLLMEKSKDIVQKTTEIIHLKDEINELKQKLLFYSSKKSTNLGNNNNNINIPNTNTNNNNNTNSKPTKIIRTPSGPKKKPKNVNQILKTTTIHKKEPNKPLPNIEPKEPKPSMNTLPINVKTRYRHPPIIGNHPALHHISPHSNHQNQKSNESITKPIFHPMQVINMEEHEMNQLPFIHRKSSTNTSSLSAAACKISLPSPTLQVSIPSPNDSTILAEIPLQLSPICELRDDFSRRNKSKSPPDSPTKPAPPKSPLPSPHQAPILKANSRPNSAISLIKISDDNSNIDNEWEQSIADSDGIDNDNDDEFSNMSKRRGNTMSISEINDDESDSPLPNDHVNDDEMMITEPGQVINKNVSRDITMDARFSAYQFMKEFEAKVTSFSDPEHSHHASTECGEGFQSDAVSYCTDNTMMYHDMIMDQECYTIQIDEYEHDGKMDGDGDGNHLNPVKENKSTYYYEADGSQVEDNNKYLGLKHEVSQVAKGHFSKKSHGNLGDCDHVIEAPMNILSFNHSFKIVLNEEKGKYDGNITSLMTSKNVSTDKHK